jgi:ubiquitin-like-conjugating enzyme ATG10
MSPRSEYAQYPFLTPSEFELACAFFDQRYIQAKLGPTRQIFKIRLRRALTTGESYIEILRLLDLKDGDDGVGDELVAAIGRLGGGGGEMEMRDEDEDMVCFVLVS